MKQPKDESKGKGKDRGKKKDKKKETKVKFNFISRKSIKRACNPAAVSYIADQEDRIWLEKTNAAMADNKTAISLELLEKVIDAAEELTFPKLLENWKKQPVVEKSCTICGTRVSLDINQKISCITCGVLVHQSCYGAVYNPEHPFECSDCRTTVPDEQKKCLLCSTGGGSFKPTTSGKFVHVMCARWNPEVKFLNKDFSEFPCNVEEVVRKNQLRQKKCLLCNSSSGAVVKCSHFACRSVFHVTCARINGLELTAIVPAERKKNDANKNEQSEVKKHRGVTRNEPTRPSLFCSKHMDKKLRRTWNDNDINSATSIYPEMTPEIMQKIYKMTPSQKMQVDEIVAFWLMKRTALDGIPLLPAHKIKINQAQHGNRKHRLNVWRSAVRRRRDIEKARLLIGMVVRREKRKKELVCLCI
ncbi:hypothetical protein WR25_12489 [Diploscapter pachys]|uniref:PHD-type domain-containing protein n=1 Tax=Diploscapter pachys TaxID=2018661 RepID=A0A2A2KD42_9BILA|nr:hypothetical protein WR25_12489 [Diploscapter pachys]